MRVTQTPPKQHDTATHNPLDPDGLLNDALDILDSSHAHSVHGSGHDSRHSPHKPYRQLQKQLAQLPQHLPLQDAQVSTIARETLQQLASWILLQPPQTQTDSRIPGAIRLLQNVLMANSAAQRIRNLIAIRQFCNQYDPL